MTNAQPNFTSDPIEQLEKRVAVLEEYLDLLIIKLVDAEVITIDEAKSGFPELPWLTPEEVDDIRDFEKKQS